MTFPLYEGGIIGSGEGYVTTLVVRIISLFTFSFKNKKKIVTLKSLANIRIPSESFGMELNPKKSELYRAISKSISGPFRIIPNQSKKLFVSRFMRNGYKSIQLNLINSGNFAGEEL